MARSRALALAPRVVVAAPAPARRSVTRTVIQKIRSHGGAALRQRQALKTTAWGVGAAAAAGYIEGHGIALPSIPALGVPGTYGLAALAWYAVTGNATAASVATGLLSAAIYETAKGSGSSPVVRASGDSVLEGDIQID